MQRPSSIEYLLTIQNLSPRRWKICSHPHWRCGLNLHTINISYLLETRLERHYWTYPHWLHWRMANRTSIPLPPASTCFLDKFLSKNPRSRWTKYWTSYWRLFCRTGFLLCRFWFMVRITISHEQRDIWAHLRPQKSIWNNLVRCCEVTMWQPSIIVILTYSDGIKQRPFLIRRCRCPSSMKQFFARSLLYSANFGDCLIHIPVVKYSTTNLSRIPSLHSKTNLFHLKIVRRYTRSRSEVVVDAALRSRIRQRDSFIF